MNDDNFQGRLRKASLMIPPGQFTTYKELARYLHSSPRAVGQGLRRNPLPIVVPCHRVISSDFSLGGYCGELKSAKKMELLTKEGLVVEGDKVVDKDKIYFYI
jgi:methylated-DNA-[protein]-cysteine S-methyltransferase